MSTSLVLLLVLECYLQYQYHNIMHRIFLCCISRKLILIKLVHCYIDPTQSISDLEISTMHITGASQSGNTNTGDLNYYCSVTTLLITRNNRQNNLLIIIKYTEIFKLLLFSNEITLASANHQSIGRNLVMTSTNCMLSSQRKVEQKNI